MALVQMDGQLFQVRLPTSKAVDSDWPNFLANGKTFFLPGMKNSVSWCMETDKEKATARTIRNISERILLERGQRFIDTGFRPCFIPLGDNGQFDKTVFGDNLGFDVVKMYSFLMDNQPVNINEPVLYRDKAKLGFSDEYFGDEYLIPFVIHRGIAMAACNLLVDISYDELAAFTYDGPEF